MTMIHRALCLAFLVSVTAVVCAEDKDTPSHDRPYFMPAGERERIRTQVQKEEWAKTEYARIKKVAEAGDGYWAAFLYALDGDEKYIATAKKWLLEKYGPKSYWIEKAAERLKDDQFFKGGQPGIPEVYYDIDITGQVAFDWAYKGLAPADRGTIQDGIVTWARYKMRCMDRWTQTPNLVFKPTYTVAVAGMATQNRDCLDWGFRRTKPYGGGLGGYFVVLESMLYDGGPWHEAPIYPGAHTGLEIVGMMSRYRSLYDGENWFEHKTANGSSPRGLMDYYLDSAYPSEVIGPNTRQVRVANYGDGSTNGAGDLFLVSPSNRPGNILLHDPLIAAYNVSGAARYAPFVAMIPGYKPDLWDRRPLPDKVEFPTAPSKVWPDYGLAMLRSDESNGYWTNPKAIAVFQLMSQGYGHDHRDKFSISMHGAGRLIYPNYNAIQYENPTIGWTRNSVSHNTLVVDEGETRDATPTGIRSEFSPEVKFLATSASGVFEGVDQTRGLFLTREYLLDLFQASSKVPHTYDYLLHSFGKAQPLHPEAFKASAALEKRYWLVDNQQSMQTKDSWAIDFVVKNAPPEKPVENLDKEWYDHTAQVRVTMAADPDSLVVHGVWGNELAKLAAERQKGMIMDRLSMLACRREGRRSTVFAVTHEPYANADKPQISSIVKLAQTDEALVVRVEGKDFTDYMALAFGPQKDGREHNLVDAGKSGGSFAFKSYGYLRVSRDGTVTARGGWTSFAVPQAKGPLTLNGKGAAAEVKNELLVYGKPAEAAPLAEQDPECPLAVTIAPAIVRVFERDRKSATFNVRNPLKEAVSGRLEFDLPDGLTAEPAKAEFGPIGPGETAKVVVTFVSDKPAAGKHTVPYRIYHRVAGAEKEVRTLARAVAVTVGPTLEYVYQHPKPPVFVVHAPKLTAKFDMFNGLCRSLADDDDTVRLEDSPLFTFGDGKDVMLGPETKQAFTWPREAPADLVAEENAKCRWQALFFGNRMMVRMDPGWTQFETTHFTVPGNWVSPGGKPRWARVVAVKDGQDVDDKAGTTLKVSAAELEFPGGKWNLAFMFEPPQQVTFNGTELKFSISSLKGENWQVGFCKPGELDLWRGKKK